MRQTTKARHTLGIRGQLMWFLCFICLFLLGLFWLLSTQLLEPLYTKHIETQLTNQADSIVERLDDAIAEGKVLSSWSFGQLAVNSDFFDKLTLELYTKGSLNSFCVDISDTTLHTIYKIENQSFCNLHGTYLSDSANNDKIIATALAMRRKCRSVGSFVQTLNPPRLSGSAQLLVGRITADGSYTVLVTTSLMHVSEAGEVMSTVLPLAAVSQPASRQRASAAQSSSETNRFWIMADSSFYQCPARRRGSILGLTSSILFSPAVVNRRSWDEFQLRLTFKAEAVIIGTERESNKNPMDIKPRSIV